MQPTPTLAELFARLLDPVTADALQQVDLEPADDPGRPVEHLKEVLRRHVAPETVAALNQIDLV